MNEWISLVEKTPEHGTDVRVKNLKGKEATAHVCICKNDEPYFSFPVGTRGLKPTHWKPLHE